MQFLKNFGRNLFRPNVSVFDVLVLITTIAFMAADSYIWAIVVYIGGYTISGVTQSKLFPESKVCPTITI